MPKILINEKDNTSPGTPGSYANYSVLIAGFMGTPSTKQNATIIEPDSNGVYEFSSAQAFKDTIGFNDDEIADGVAEAVNTDGEEHYGKRMALALLELGYTIIYKPIKSVSDLNEASFWEDFYDKASYDFRFVSHGLLKTDCDIAAYDKLSKRREEVLADMTKFAEITATGTTNAKNGIGETPFEKLDEAEQLECIANACQAEYARVIADGYTGFKETTTTGAAGLQYGNYAQAKAYLAGADDKCEGLSVVDGLLENFEGLTPGVFNNINGLIAKLASYRTSDDGTVLCAGRGDCTALIELDENCYVQVGSSKRPEHLIAEGINNIASINSNVGPYCAMTVPSVNYSINKKAIKFPGAFHYLACFMNSLSSGFAEWYAAAGYTRGVSSYVIDHTTVKLGEVAINALEPRNLDNDPQTTQPKFACNVIANFRGSYYLWGNRTAAELKAELGGNDLTAEHFLNIRQLCTTLKKQIYVACRRFTFDPNSDTLWFNFVNAITPTLDRMKADQGVKDYRILKVFTDKKATLKAKIRIIPIEAVEDFDIEVSLEDSFGGVSVAAN
jgi:hypothetical protein